MESPPANSPNGPAGERAGTGFDLSTGIIDFKVRERRSELLKYGCEVAAVGRRYRETHHTLFGFTVRRALLVLHPDRIPDYAAFESELDTIGEETRRIEYAMVHCGLEDLPRRAKTAIAFRDGLLQYARAVADAAQNLHHLCRCLRQESLANPEFADYSEERFRNDRAVYDASVQEFMRWGARLTELSEKL